MSQGADATPHLVGIGMSVLDILTVVPEFPSAEGVTEAIDSILSGGGPVPTALCAASRYGVRATMLDRLSDDWIGRQIQEEYLTFGVDGSHLLTAPRSRGTVSTNFTREADGARHIVFRKGDAPDLTDADLPRSLLQSCDILHLNGRHWPACLHAAEIVKKSGGMVSFDGGAGRFQERFLELLPMVDILIVAAEFAQAATRADDREQQLASLSQYGAQWVGITDGEAGSWFLGAEGERFHQPAFRVRNLVDTTGCGDVFHGVFLAHFAATGDAKSSALLAARAASLKAEGLGGRFNLKGRQELENSL